MMEYDTSLYDWDVTYAWSQNPNEETYGPTTKWE